MKAYETIDKMANQRRKVYKKLMKRHWPMTHKWKLMTNDINNTTNVATEYKNVADVDKQKWRAKWMIKK